MKKIIKLKFKSDFKNKIITKKGSRRVPSCAQLSTEYKKKSALNRKTRANMRSPFE